MLNTISLFSGAGVAELLSHRDINVLLANEINKKRAELYSFFYPETKMINGDILDSNIQNKIKSLQSDIDLIIATPPCQGVSSLGKNKVQQTFLKDKRNFLIFGIFSIIKFYKPKYCLIENTERFSKMLFPHKGRLSPLIDILINEFGEDYDVDFKLMNCQDYGVPQSRPRTIFRLYKKGTTWDLPAKKNLITLRDCISNLPSLIPGESSDIKWHNAIMHKKEVIECLIHTPEGKSALTNQVHYPKNKDGNKVKGFHNTYKRISWDKPCPTRTTYCGSVSSHNTVHPGRKLKDGTYSDPRVLTLLETFIVSSIPKNIKFPVGATESFIREIIGEAVPPLFIKEVLKGIL